MRPDRDALEIELAIFFHVVKKSSKNWIGQRRFNLFEIENKTLFPLTRRCFRLLPTIPVASASAERSFSEVKLEKTFMRSAVNKIASASSWLLRANAILQT